jgi:formamidopyrimidine-DNA glycosylase
VRRSLAPRLAGRAIIAVEEPGEHRYEGLALAAGRRIEDVGRRGKYLLIALEGGLELIVHLGMTGACLVGPAERSHLRWRARLDDGSTLDFDDPRRFGRAWVRPAGQWSGIRALERMGPEPVTGPPPSGVLRALQRKAMIKPLLLSQEAVAGLGNIYADEALWLARVHPRQRGLGSRKAAELAAAIAVVLGGAVERGGTTLRNYRDPDGRSGRNQVALNVYGREGDPCPRCGSPIRKFWLGGRGTHYCPRCQRRYQVGGRRPHVG